MLVEVTEVSTALAAVIFSCNPLSAIKTTQTWTINFHKHLTILPVSSHSLSLGLGLALGLGKLSPR